MEISSAPLPPPFVDIQGIANFRELGGENNNTNNGSGDQQQQPPFARGLVYRCADPSKATAQGLAKMCQELGITHIFDLRSLPEIHRDSGSSSSSSSSNTNTITTSSSKEEESQPQDPNAALTHLFTTSHITRRWTPVFAAQDYGPEQIALRYKSYTRQGSEGFVEAYRNILLHAGEAFGKVLRHLISEEGARGGLVIHCTAGKDRTGLLSALLLSLAGWTDGAIADEYALTEVGLAPLREELVRRLLEKPVLAGDEAGVRNMVGSRRENMLASLGMVRGEFGGWEAYVRERCGLGEGEVGRLVRRVRGEGR